MAVPTNIERNPAACARGAKARSRVVPTISSAATTCPLRSRNLNAWRGNSASTMSVSAFAASETRYTSFAVESVKTPPDASLATTE